MTLSRSNEFTYTKILEDPEAEGATPLTLYFGEVGDHTNLCESDRDRLYAELDRLCPERLTLANPGRIGDEVPITIPPDCQQAMNELAGHFYKLVITIARKYRGNGVPLSDLIQEGNVGLVKGLWKYDPTLGYKVSTYVTWWIRQSVSRAVATQGRTVRLPVHTHDRYRRIIKAIAALETQNGETTIPEIAREAGLTQKEVKYLLAVVPQTDALSLDQKIDNERIDGINSYHYLEDDGPPPNEIIETNTLQDCLVAILERLPARNQRILHMRFGLNGYKPMTLEEIGAKEGLTRERIRQIEKETLQRLRHPRYARRLREFMP